MANKFTVQSTRINAGILLLTLTPTSEKDRLRFAPGQYAAISFKRNGRPTPVRCFSIVSSPNDRWLQFAIRILGPFTQAAAQLQPGDKVSVEGPFGDFTLDEEHDEQVVMLAAGIGITPFISMLRYATEEQLAIPITLLFTNRSLKNMPFKEELLALVQANPRLRLYFFVTGSEVDMMPSYDNVRFIAGSITQTYVERLTAGAFQGSTYFICGPKGFMKGMRKELRRNHVDETRVITESFTQATKSLRLSSKFGIQPLTYGLTAASLVAMTGFIMFLDLSRNTANVATTKASTTAQTATSSASASSAKSSATTTQPTTSDTSTSSTATAPTSTAQTTQTYQQPVSSVS
ncbi:MAG TPA: FAD-dependent oxidoreductase [Candidatus Saccharimonadales bacterium]